MPYSRECAINYVIGEIERKGAATRDDFDVAAIVAESHAAAESWNFSTLDRPTFWRITARHLK